MKITPYTNTEGPIRAASILTPSSPLWFIYSPQPVIVEIADGETEGIPVSFTVTSNETGASYTETRDTHNGKASIDVSRIMQILTKDVETVFDRPEEEAVDTSFYYEIVVSYEDADGVQYEMARFSEQEGVYGALDAGESYGNTVHRRLWVNFPQTFGIRRASTGLKVIRPINATPSVNKANKAGYALNYIKLLTDLHQESTVEDVTRYIETDKIITSWDAVVQSGSASTTTYRIIEVRPDYSKPDDGIYLRWLDRSGETCSWLFRKSKLSTKTTLRDSFSRYYSGDLTAPTRYSRLVNPLRAEYAEARELTVGDDCVSSEEFDALVSLATSPLVEMLVSGSAAPSSAPALLKDRLYPPYVWQRVNIVPGTFARSDRRDTPKLHSIEFVIELPQRHTARL